MRLYSLPKSTHITLILSIQQQIYVHTCVYRTEIHEHIGIILWKTPVKIFSDMENKTHAVCRSALWRHPCFNWCLVYCIIWMNIIIYKVWLYTYILVSISWACGEKCLFGNGKRNGSENTFAKCERLLRHLYACSVLI